MSERIGTGRPSNRAKARPETETPFRRLQARGGQLLQWFPELGKTLLREGEPGLESILGQIQTLRGEVRRRAGVTGRDLEARAERLLGDLERQAVERLQPLLNRAHVASQRETGVLEDRLAHLEGRLGPLLDERAALSSRVADLEHQLGDVRVELRERVRELDLRLATTDDVRGDLVELRGHIDAVAKEQLARSLELSKLHDRVARMEMRFGDLLKEHGTHLADHEDVKKRLGALATELEAATRLAKSAADEATHATTAAYGSAERLAALTAERVRERTDVEQLGERGLEIERIIRQLELRLGDLAERHTGAREDLAGLAARMAQLELTTAPPPAPSTATERTEGH
jgi:chromosome segregation ATPase